MGGKPKSKEPRILIEASRALPMENKQSTLPSTPTPLPSPPPPPTTTSTKASKISLGLLTKEMDDQMSVGFF
jgi:hypothetical protein